MKKNLAKNAQQIAKHGRYGDDRLLHVSQAEIDGLASLLPGGKLPHNPETGLPEAFFFLPFLASLGAAAAPAAAGLGTAAATAVPAALAAAAPTAATLGTAAGAAGAAGTAGMLASAAPTAASIGASAVPAAAGLTAASAAPAATGIGSLSAAAPTAASMGTAGSMAAPTASTGLVAPTTAAAGPAASGIGSLTSTGSGIGAGAGASGTANLASGVTSAAPASATTPAASSGIAGAMPSLGAGAGAEAAASGAVNLGQSGGLGSLFGGMDMNKLLQYGAMAAMMMPQSGGKGDSEDDKEKDVGAKDYSPGDTATPPDGGASGGLSPEFDFFPGSHYYAEGGIASLGSDKSGMDDETLIDATVAAIQGQTPNADAIVQMFLQRFGPQALQDLLSQVQATQSNSDGMSDSVPAQISGPGQTAPAQISEGEYIVPADAVSGLGNGSTMAGARQLDDMVKRTRDMRGMPAQPKGINPMQAMPV